MAPQLCCENQGFYTMTSAKGGTGYRTVYAENKTCKPTSVWR